MALSNWDTMAVDLSGPSRGLFVREEVQVEIYKNWLYLRDARAWHEATGYSEPTVGRVAEGDLSYKHVKVLARRGPQDGVFAIVQSGWVDTLKVMVGCGVNGYGESAWPCGHQNIANYRCGSEIDGMTCSECGGPAPLPEWVGVSEESREFLGKMVVEEFSWTPAIADALLSALKVGVRFNQGDAFFAEQLGAEIPATPVGQAEPTIMSGLIGTMNKENG